MCRCYSKLISTLIFISLLIALTCARKKKSLGFYLTVETDLVKEAYYLKHVFHLLYDYSVTPADELLYFSLILYIVV